MPRLPLNEFASVILDASGNGTASIGPRAPGEVWYPETVSNRVSTPVTNSPNLETYAGNAATPDNFVDGSYTGELNGTDQIKGQVLRLGQKVFSVWTAGDPGNQATLTVTGTKDIP
jgi:hypothetical protein